MKGNFDTFALVQRMRAMVYSSKDFESLWFLYQAEGLPKDLSIEEFFASKASRARALHKAWSSCVPSVASERSSSGLSYFRHMVQEDA